MSRILIISIMYAPEPTGFAPLVTDLATYLGQQGWSVTVITSFPQAPHWRVYEGYGGRLHHYEDHGPVAIRRGMIYVPHPPKQGLMKAWRRVLFDSSFGATALILALGIRRPDLIVAVSPPLQVGLPAIMLRWWWRIPLVLWVQDIVPDAAVITSMMKDGLLLRLARRFEKYVYAKSDAIALIAPGFVRNLVAKGVAATRIVEVPNWAESIELKPSGARDWRAELGLDAKAFLLVHAGSVAAKQCLETAVRAMKLMEEEQDVHLLIVGAGNRLNTVREEAARLGVVRVRFLPPVPPEEHRELLKSADALLLSQCADVTDMVMPSKLLTYLPSGRAVLAAVRTDSEAGRFLSAARCALIVPPGDPAELAAGIRKLREDPKLRARLAGAGLERVQQLDRKLVLPEFEGALRRILGDIGA